MARAICTLLAAGLLLAGCGRGSTQGVPEEIQGVVYGDYVIGEPIRFANLTVFPVSSPTPRTDDRFITLDEGLKAGTVEIRERGTGATGANLDVPSIPAPNADDAPNPQRQGAPPPAAQGRSGAQTPETQQARANDPLEAPAPNSVIPPAPEPGGQQAQAAQSELPSPQPQQLQASRGGGASVNELMVVNRSGKPLYLMPGEVIIGGQQDRAIGQELIVESTGQPTAIPVFCVEQRRWAQRDVAHNVAYLSTVQANDAQQLSRQELEKLAEEANNGKFVKGAGNVNKDVRLAVQGAMDQSKVWEEVSKANSKNGAQSQSGAFTANYGDKELAEKLDPYLEGLHKPVTETRNVIGVIVAVNGKAHSIDVFESTPLFQKLWPKLLKSYALDALGHGQEADAEKSCDTAAAVDFVKQACEAKLAKQDEKAGVSLTHRENDKVACFTVCKPEYADAAPSVAKPAAPIHLNALAK
jgi:hypothetical protein